MLDAIGLARLIGGMATAWLALIGSREAIREGLAVVGQHGLDHKGGPLFHPLHERLRVLRGLAASDLQIYPSGRSVYGHVQVAFLLLIGRLGQVLDVDVYYPGA